MSYKLKKYGSKASGYLKILEDEVYKTGSSITEIVKREHYDIATSRAVAKLNVLLEYMIPFVKVGGRCICMKSFEIDEELKDAEKAIEILGGKIEKVDEITLPNTDIQRKIVVIKKIKSTPNKYPRKAGMPLKEPIL